MPEFLIEDFFAGLFLVLATNVVLSGDNAVVIAVAARTLEGSQRRKAIFWGAAGAVVLRLIFAGVVAQLLTVPFLQMAGGLLLFWIAWGLLHEDTDEESKVRAATGAWEAIRIIIVADAVMSLDNVIALVGAAGGDFLLLAIGITTTIPLVVFGSALLAFLLDRFPALVYAGAGLLVYIGVEMCFEDVAFQEYLEAYMDIEWLVAVVAAGVFLALARARAGQTGGAEQRSKRT